MKGDTIPQEKLDAARDLREQYHDMSWREIGERVGAYGETLRSHFRKPRKRGPRKHGGDSMATQTHPVVFRRRRRDHRKPRYDSNAVASFYLGEGDHDKVATAKRFGITTWCVNTALIEAGYPDEACPSIVATRNKHPIPPQATIIVPQEGNSNGTFKDLLLDHVAYLTSLETKVSALEQKVGEQAQTLQRRTNQVLEAQTVLSQLK